MLLQSGSSVPEWILKLPKPSKMKRRQMGKVKRIEMVNTARKIGRNDAVKIRCVVACFLLGHSSAHDLVVQGHDRWIQTPETQG